MSLSRTYKVNAKGGEIQAAFGGASPFNLKVDEKSMNRDEITRIEEEVANILHSGKASAPGFSIMRYSTKNRNIFWAKMRVADPLRNKGKSKGYRCIVLVDRCNLKAFVLHIYRHGHGEDENISSKDKNQMNELLELYASNMSN